MSERQVSFENHCPLFPEISREQLWNRLSLHLARCLKQDGRGLIWIIFKPQLLSKLDQLCRRLEENRRGDDCELIRSLIRSYDGKGLFHDCVLVRLELLQCRLGLRE